MSSMLACERRGAGGGRLGHRPLASREVTYKLGGRKETGELNVEVVNEFPVAAEINYHKPVDWTQHKAILWQF